MRPWCLTPTSGADELRRYIGRTVLATEFAVQRDLLLHFDGGATILVSLREEDRRGPEALEFVPARADGTADLASMWIW